MFKQTAEVSCQDQHGASRDDIGQLVADHLVRDVRVFDAEHSAEAAARLGSGQLFEREPVDRCEQPARLILDPSSRNPEHASW